MKITVDRRCGCKGPDGRQLGAECPKLAQRRHGSWRWRLRVPKDLVPLVGKATLFDSGYATKREAEAAGEEAAAKVRSGQQAIGGLTVGTFLTEQWLPGKRRLRPTSQRRYEQYIRLHLVPFLGDIQLTALRAHHIAQAYERAEAASASRKRAATPATIRHVHAMFKSALQDAVRQRMLTFNPADTVELPEHHRVEVDPWEATEVGAFLDEAAADRLSAMWELIAFAGLRRGEACGATWQGLDSTLRVLTISQQITDSGGEPGVWAPKTRASKGLVDLHDGLIEELEAHRAAQDAERQQIGDAWDNGTLPDEQGRPVHLKGLMFTRPDGRYLDPQWVTRRMGQIARRAGLCTTVRTAAAAGATELEVGVCHREPLGRWTLYVDREPVGEVTVAAVARRSGTRACLTLAEPLPVALDVDAELGQDLLSRRRLHDLRHSSASIQIAEGISLTTVSKRLRHSSTSITGNVYAHLLRSSGQQAAETVAAAIPRAKRRVHPASIQPVGGSEVGGESAVLPGETQAR